MKTLPANVLAAVILCGCHTAKNSTVPAQRAPQAAEDVAPVIPRPMRLYGAPGRTYTLEASTNLNQTGWVEVWRGVMPASMETNLPPMDVPQSSVLFFRSVTLP